MKTINHVKRTRLGISSNEDNKSRQDDTTGMANAISEGEIWVGAISLYPVFSNPFIFLTQVTQPAFSLS